MRITPGNVGTNRRNGAFRAAAIWAARLDDPVPIGPIVYFRIVLGLSMFAWAMKALAEDWVQYQFVEPVFHFKYPGFTWVRVLPGNGMHWSFLVLTAASIGQTFGVAYRLNALLVAMGFTYAFLCDKALYQNHYYLICLLAWLAVFLPAGRAFSIDALLRPAIRVTMAPRWSLWLLRFQLAVPYVFGGIAKLDADWLRGQPMRAALAAQADKMPPLGQVFNQDWCVWLIVYGGLLFDLLIIPALLWRRTRPFAFVLAIAFHLTNATLFDIGVFPWLMALTTAIFFPPDFFQRLFRLDRRPAIPSLQPAQGFRTRGLLRAARCGVLATYVALQVLVPLRHFVYPGPVSWTEQGHYFSWHMMLRGKRSAVRIYATDPKTGRTGTIDLREYLSPHQAARFARDPEMIYQLCQFIAKDLANRGFAKVQLRALALVGLNGRKPQLLVDPTVDLAAADPPGLACKWIVPLAEPFRAQAWDVRLDQWEQRLELSDITTHSQHQNR